MIAIGGAGAPPQATCVVPNQPEPVMVKTLPDDRCRSAHTHHLCRPALFHLPQK